MKERFLRWITVNCVNPLVSTRKEVVEPNGVNLRETGTFNPTISDYGTIWDIFVIPLYLRYFLLLQIVNLSSPHFINLLNTNKILLNIEYLKKKYYLQLIPVDHR